MDTEDKIFLLSISEAEQYFDLPQARQCEATAFVLSQGSNTAWWLRSPGGSGDDAARVGSGGYINSYGRRVNDYGGVRPALWINLES